MILELPEGSSGSGISYYEKLLGCNRQAFLSNNETLVKSIGGSDGQAIGIIMHAFLELYDNGQLKYGDLENLEIKEHWAIKNPSNIVESRRLMNWWMTMYDPGHFGRTIGTEIYLKDNENLKNLFGIPLEKKLTARLDLVTEVDDKHAERFYRLREKHIEPGLWIVDHKWYRARSGFLGVQESMQMLAYPLIFEEWKKSQPELKDKPLNGVIIHFGIKTKVPGSEIVIRYPDPEEDIQILRAFFKEALENEKKGNVTNPTLCYPFAKNACPFAPTENGICRRF